MSNIRYLICSKCGSAALPSAAVMNNGKLVTPAEAGTSTLMRCKDCCDPSDKSIPNSYYATMCRQCCPSNHGTYIYSKFPERTL